MVDNVYNFTPKNAAPNPSAGLKSGGSDGTSGSMDAWQTSVEARLGEIKTDVRELRTGIGSLSVSVATLTERVAHLPSKGYMAAWLIAAISLITVVITFQSTIQTFFKLPH